jgi:hypothetical protein
MIAKPALVALFAIVGGVKFGLNEPVSGTVHASDSVDNTW